MKKYTLEDLRDLLPSEAYWAVLHTRPRCEKKVMGLFMQEGICTYAPMMIRSHQYGVRERENEIPVFSGYVFCAYEKEKQGWIRQNQYVANLLPVQSPAVMVEQLAQIELALNEGQDAEVYTYLVEGNRVRIRSGPMKGVEGVIQQVRGQSKVVLNLELIQQSVAMEVDASLLEPIL